MDTLDNDVQPSNTCSPIDFTLSGIEISFNAVHFLKELDPILTNELGNVTFVNEEQSENK